MREDKRGQMQVSFAEKMSLRDRRNKNEKMRENPKREKSRSTKQEFPFCNSRTWRNSERERDAGCWWLKNAYMCLSLLLL